MKLPKRKKKPAVMINGVNKDDLLNEFEAAEFLGISVSWLRQSRVKKPKWPGPKYVQPDGYHIKYDKCDLQRFLKTRYSNPRVVDPAKRMQERRR